MDNNNTPAAQPSVNPPAGPTVPQVQTPESSPDSQKMIMMFVIGLVIVIALVGGIYFFLSKQQPAGDTAKTIIEQPAARTTPTQTPETLDALDRDIAAVKVEETEADFVEIDQDLQQL